MKCIVKSCGFSAYKTDLRDALAPSHCSDMGRLEEAEGLAMESCAAVGRLLELLVEKKVISLDEAVRVSGTYSTIVITDEAMGGER